MFKIKQILIVALAILAWSCTGAGKPQMVKRVNQQFFIGDKPYYYVGANYWYGAILGSKGRGGNRDRLIKELDQLKEMGVTNLRVLAGAEGPDDQPYRVSPALQLSPGVYNDTLLDGLDFLMAELAKRDMRAVLFLNNTWEWSGGFSQYVNWNGGGEIPYPEIPPHTWPEFMDFAARFLHSDACKAQYQNHIRFMLGRTNAYTGVKYTDDPYVMTWEIANEPRALADENKEIFAQWVSETAAFIKSLAPNQLVTTGTEGSHGCQTDIELYKKIHADANIDYLVFHIWPKNWSWLNVHDIPGSVDSAIAKTNAYMDRHLNVARDLNKPAVFEEFGLPRDNHLFVLTDPTTARDKFYQNAFARVEESAKNNGALAGSNFWAYSGLGRAAGDENPFWSKGDDLMGDPPQEEQGLNSVFDTDSTVGVVKEHAKRLASIINTK